MSELETYTTDQVVAKWRISLTSLTGLINEGYMPYRRAGRMNLFPRSYIDGFVNLFAIGIEHGYRHYDAVFARLWYLRYRYYECAPPTRGSQNPHQRRVHESCAALVESGQAMRLETFCEGMERFATAEVSSRWARKNKIMSVKLGMSRYMSVAYARHLHHLFAMWPTLSDVSCTLGVPYQTLVSRRSKGAFIAYEMPDGQLRVDPAYVETSDKNASPSLLCIDDAAARIGIDSKQLHAAACGGLIESVIVRGLLRIPESAVVYWRARFTTINPGFDWLDREKKRLGGMKLMTPRQVSRTLGVAIPTLSGWFKADLLPYYITNFGREESTFKEVPARYVHGLERFAHERGLPMQAPTLREYRALCAQKKLIV